MSTARTKYVSPNVESVSFNCPHCGALAKQFWYHAKADELKKDQTPNIWTSEKVEQFNYAKIEDADERKKIAKLLKKMSLGRPFFERSNSYVNYDIPNLFISKCYSCDDISLWMYNKLLWPLTGEAPFPNTDLPAEVLRDYEEAGAILNLSPRGSAALLRLCIQKLCAHLGEKGKNINEDIASLVRRGLDARVQQALDIVRVVGNNAVHPGTIDLKDDRATAEKLFGLVNLIADVMISQPKHISAMFDGLPEGDRNAIEKRDKVN